MKKRKTLIIIVLIPALLFLGILAVSLFNRIQVHRWNKRLGQNHHAVEIDGRQFSYIKRGSSAECVVILHEIGSSAVEWIEIIERLQNSFSVLAYDRPGYGWSTESGALPDSEAAAMDLDALLTGLGIDRKVILVGDGIGSLYAEHFAVLFPERVEGIVSVDPVTRDYFRFKNELRRVFYSNLIDRRAGYKMGKIVAELGLIRLFNVVPYPKSPDALNKPVMESYASPARYDVMIEEYRDGLESSIEKLGDRLPPVTIPHIVIHHDGKLYRNELMTFYLSWDEAEDIENLWLDIDQAIVNRSPLNSLVISDGVIRNIRFGAPELIVSAVESVK